MNKSAVVTDKTASGRSRQGSQRRKRWLSILRDNGWRALLLASIVAL
ncbi:MULTISPECIES: hypothetical protein [Symbiopectobacterium]|nr:MULTISPECIES: hypothetical protein [Symbiopectobacterium]